MPPPRPPDLLTSHPACRLHRLQVLRPWRILFVFYLLALTTGSHWPNLTFGPEVPASDKTIHVLAFASLTFLLWFTQWVPSRWLTALLALVWAVIDESTQSIPGLNRSVSWFDFACDALGIIIALAWLWALAPIGLGPNRARHALIWFSLQQLFASRAAWLIVLLSAAVGAGILLALWPFFDPFHKFIPEIIAVNIASALAILILYRLWLRASRIIRTLQPCFACGRPAVAIARDPSAACPRCDQSHAVDWSHALIPPPRAVARRHFLVAAFILFLAILAVFLLIFLLTLIYSWLLPAQAPVPRGAPRLVRMLSSLPAEFTNAIDLSFLLILLAATIRLYRRRLARWYDRMACCAACGFDLRATPVNPLGHGVCPECGARFSLS